MDDGMKSRKFLLSVFFSVVGSVALFMGKLSGGEFLALLGTVQGIYVAGNVAQRKIEAGPK